MHYIEKMNEISPATFPKTLLILGTDLAGKDHCANVLADAAISAGIKVERRRGSFSAQPDRSRTSEGKGGLSLWLEWVFLSTIPLHCRFLPYLIAILVRGDLRRFRRPPDGSVIVVSHTAIRLLAFALGHIFERVEDIRLPVVVDAALRAVIPATDARTIVLDIDHEVREARMNGRLRRGTADCFDRYMGKDPIRSERIENFLVWVGTTYFNAVRIVNNNLSDAELLSACMRKDSAFDA